MHFEEQLALIRKTRQVHPNWYRETYPEVAALKIDPAVHYLRYGAALGRNPGKTFDTRRYLAAYPDAAASGLNPLVHYALHGAALGYSKMPPRRSVDLRRVGSLRTKLLSLGFTEAPLAELAQIAAQSDDPEARAQAARELGLWHMRQKTHEDYGIALTHLRAARPDATDLTFRRKLAVAELLCHHFRDENDAAEEVYHRAIDAGELSADLLLAAANLDPEPERRIDLINRVLALRDIPPVGLLPDDGRPAYDRLTSAAPLPVVTDGPLVTVLIASYDAAETLPTALRSLQEQTWQNLEILVLDDCSPDPGTSRVAEAFAARDPRIRLIRMETNGGAYVARNRGLDEARGTYVTLHDADDWSHPLKIETQVRFMEANPEVMGTTSMQARAFSDLGFTRWTGAGHFIITNVSSFMFRREPVKAQLGYWDTVRFSGDSEFIRRIKEAFGKDSVVDLPDGPLSFQRDSHTSIVADAILGMNGFFFGARREYLHAQAHYRRAENSLLTYSGDIAARPYPVPVAMLPDRAERLRAQGKLDLIVGADLRQGSPSVEPALAALAAAQEAGRKTAVFEMLRYDFTASEGERISVAARDALWQMGIQILTFGEEVECETLLLIDPAILLEPQRYLPTIRPDAVRVLLNDDADTTGPEDSAMTDAAREKSRELFGLAPEFCTAADAVSPARRHSATPGHPFSEPFPTPERMARSG